MIDASSTILTERQVEVLELRLDGLTQHEVADKLGTTDANISAIERAAEANVDKARQTLHLMRILRSSTRFSAPAGTEFEDLVDKVFAHADRAGIRIGYTRPNLYAHLYQELEAHTRHNQLNTDADIGLTRAGEVQVFAGTRDDAQNI